MKSLISVIIPIYNVEQYLDRCIDSVVNQTYSNLEIILVNDGSSDACPEKCEVWALKDERIIVIHKQNEGIGFARNTGLDVANGEYVLFLDSDDYLPKNSIEVMYNAIVAQESDLVVGEAFWEYPDGDIRRPEPKVSQITTITGKESLFMAKDNSIVHCCVWAKLYKKRLFETIRFKQLKCCEDLDVWPLITELCERITVIPNYVYCYYQRSSSIVHNMSQERKQDAMKAKINVSKFFLDHGFLKASHQYFRFAVTQGYELNNPGFVRSIVKKVFTKRELIRLFGNLKTLICWMALQLPMIQRIIKGAR